ncbi:MAG: polysaccharide deacetylase family protein [Bacteroidales bacterium]|nr:polysaccharide deacetylase family protein [Bacteroidales bacterium]
MNNQEKKKLIISIDVDSPIKLMNFYRINNVVFDQNKLELFYETAFNRVLDFFNRLNIKATFFVVGDELQNSANIKNIILQAYKSGHEIENHTYSHPFGLATFSEEKIKEEIILCNQIIEKITGVTPVGFRSPGCSINSKVINIVADLGLKYDSSGFWSILIPLIKVFQSVLFKNGLNNADFGSVTNKLMQYPYIPSENNWLIPDTKSRQFLELPFPRTNVLGLPFYNCFNLWAPSIYTNYISKKTNKPYMMYLFHIIEFMDSSDGIPEELGVHPNIKTPVKDKIQKSERILSDLFECYELTRARDFVRLLLNNNCIANEK